MIEVCNKIFNCSFTKFENPDFVDESHQLGVALVFMTVLIVFLLSPLFK